MCRVHAAARWREAADSTAEREKSAPRRWRFDWSDVRRYVRLARARGLTHFEWCHPFTSGAYAHAIRIYHGQGRDENFSGGGNPATSPVYRAFLAQYLPELRAFLDQERIFKIRSSTFPTNRTVRTLKLPRARGLLRELAPWMKDGRFRKSRLRARA